MDDLGLKKVKKILDNYNMSYKGLQWCEQFREIKGLYDSGDTRRTQNYAK